MDIQERVSRIAAYGAGWVLWLLVALSVIALAIVIERAVTFFLSRDDVSELKAELEHLLEQNEPRRAQKRLDASPSFEARVAAAGLRSEGAASAEERMLAETELVRLTMQRRLAFLGTLGNNAPFVGLLGTVIGIIRAFRQLDASAGQLSSGLMAEIGEALIATAVGLLVALPAVVAFNAFQQLIKSRLANANALGREVLAYLKRGSAGAQPAE